MVIGLDDFYIGGAKVVPGALIFFKHQGVNLKALMESLFEKGIRKSEDLQCLFLM